MKEYRGKSVFEGIAIGRLKIVRHAEKNMPIRCGTPEEEKAKFFAAREKAAAELRQLYASARTTLGEEGAEIFNMHAVMTEDGDLEESVLAGIEKGKSAARAVEEAGFALSQNFIRMEDEYMKARAVDAIDVADRIADHILGKTDAPIDLQEPAILASSDFTPSEVVRLDKDKVLGFVTAYGSENSHTAILARTLALPSVVNTRDSIDVDFDGGLCVVDGFSGRVIVGPDAETLADYEAKKRETDEAGVRRRALIHEVSVTSDGKKLPIFCNVGNTEDVKRALAEGCEGIGLFRSEFLYLESEDYPTEEAQFAAYRTVLESMGGKKVVIRTLDIGADKQIDYFKLDKEENPALGYRAIRICLTRPEIFKTQLRALMRASVYGNLSIMFPMIISVGEVRQIKKMLDTVKAELNAEGIPYKDDVEIGIMIETPASVIISDELAKEVDFFSVGTNDLTQYTLACDRQNPKLEPFCDTHHPAILRMIKMAADNAHKNGCWIGICGELGADTSLTEVFLAMGIDELSVSPGMVLPVRDQIINSSVKDREEEVLKAAGVL